MAISRTDVVFTVAVMLAAALMLAIVVSAQPQDPPLDPRIAAYDKGAAKIDVSKYPADMQAGYKLFATRCSKCHTIARAINCEFALEDEWERYVKRMMRKPGSGISASDGQKIYEFLAFDSKTRKKALYEKKLKQIK